MTVRVKDVVKRDIAPFEIAKAVISSFWKHSFVKDTFVRDRSAFEKYQRSVIGDMAKLSVKSWLEEKSFKVTDWDDIRKSWRSQRKNYDIQVNNHNIEIRSSISQYITINDVLINENIIHPCNVKVKEITFQVFFSDNRCSELWICGWALREDLDNNSLRNPLRIGPRLVDFFRMPFSHAQARTTNTLLKYLKV